MDACIIFIYQLRDCPDIYIYIYMSSMFFWPRTPICHSVPLRGYSLAFTHCWHFTGVVPRAGFRVDLGFESCLVPSIEAPAFLASESPGCSRQACMSQMAGLWPA